MRPNDVIFPLSQRLCVFRWMAAVALDLGKDRISHVIVKMLTPIHREMNNTATSHGRFSLIFFFVRLVPFVWPILLKSR